MMTTMKRTAAVLAVAAPVEGGDDITLTNRRWRFSRSAVAKRFGFAQLTVINDFVAIAWALLRLDPAVRALALQPLPGIHGGAPTEPILPAQAVPPVVLPAPWVLRP